MRTNIRKIALPVTVAAVLIAALPSPNPAKAAAGVSNTDISAAQTKQAPKKQKKPRTTRSAPVNPPPPSAVRGWRPADPSFDQYGRPYQPPPWLDCPVDLGYGRWGSCNTFN